MGRSCPPCARASLPSTSPNSSAATFVTPSPAAPTPAGRGLGSAAGACPCGHRRARQGRLTKHAGSEFRKNTAARGGWHAALGAAAFAPGLLRAADPGVGDAEVVFGHTGILTGPLGGQIKIMLAGAELAFAESRAQGGVSGRRVRIVSLDDELKPERAVANYEKLLGSENVFGFFGCVGSATTAEIGRAHV